MPTDEDFFITGCSLCTSNNGAFFSWTDIQETCTESEWNDFKRRFKDILVRNQSRLWAYNLQFEQQVSFREFGCDLEICDASVYNILEAYHGKRYSLKWTAQRVLGINSWDDDFDYLNDKMNEMFYELVPDPTNPKKKTVKVLKCAINTFEYTPEFREICNRYPGYKDKFIKLIKENFGNTYACIPSEILGFYCNLDSFYTLMIHLEHKHLYPDECRETYLDNIRLGARLHTGGMYKDEEFRLKYESECHRMMAYGITYSATVHCKLKMDFHKANANDLSLYNEPCEILLRRGEFMKGDPMLIAKRIIMNNLSDLYESGLDEGTILSNYGEDIYSAIIDGLRSTNTKADKSITRKRKPFAPIVENLTNALNLNHIKLGKGHDELEKYLYFKSAYESFLDIWKNQMTDIYHIPNTFKFNGETYDIESYNNKIKGDYFNCTSPKDYPEMMVFIMDGIKYESVFLTSVYYNKNKLPDIDKFYVNRGINTIEEAYDHFLSHISEYPEDIQKEAVMYLNDPYCENMTSTIDKMVGFWKQADFFMYIREDYDSLTLPYSEEDFVNKFLFIRKFVIMQNLYKKYNKVLTTYVGGLFKDNDRLVHDTELLIPDKKAKPGDEGAVTKMFPRFMVCEKSTKRWSSPYHTIIAHSDIKKIVSTPKGYLLSYFDISSAEVRTLAYRSGDPKMIELFESKQDLYVYCAKIAFPDLDFSDPWIKKGKRGTFKQILLGKMYGMGDNTLSSNAGITLEESNRLSNILFDQFRVLKGFINDNMQYPLSHNGYLRTLLGDTLKSDAWRYLRRPDGRIDNSSQQKVMRHGINYVVQGASACILARGFWNNIRAAKKEGFVLEPIIVVHDSNTNYFPINKLFELKPFYDKNFTEFCRHQCGVPFLFDTLIGTNYNDAVELTQIDDKTIKLKGACDALNQILDKIEFESNLKVSCDKTREEIKSDFITNPIERFIKADGTSVVMDRNKSEIILTKLN